MDLTGQKLGKYELLEKLGQGGMAQVYKARQPLIERFVAIKVMLTNLIDSEQFVSRFLREAQRLGQLRHPNIVSILDFDIVEGTHFLVMDFVSGPSLATYLDMRKSLLPVEALKISSQITSALQYAHGKGVVHCDLKPANVMFQDETHQQVVLTDFGIARMLDATGQAQTSTVIGTPSYISPEAAQGQPLDGRADIYSLGIMMYEMVTGAPPFVADTPLSVMMKHLQEPPPNLNTTHPQIPAPYSSIVEKALAKSPADRFRSAADMGAAIEDALGHLHGQASTISVSQPQEGQLVAPPGSWSARSASTAAGASMPQARKKPLPLLWMGAIALVILALFIVGAIGLRLLSSSRGEKNPPVAVITNTAPATEVVSAGGSAPIQTQPGGSLEATPTIDVLPLEAGKTGSLFLLSDGGGSPSQIGVQLYGISPPPQGKAYVMWVGNGEDMSALGELQIEGRNAYLITDIDNQQLASFTQALVSLEDSGSSPNQPSSAVLIHGEYSEPRLVEFRSLNLSSDEPTQKAYLFGILEQALLAYDHQGYAIGELENGALEPARAHAEHVINILAGKNGPQYGDRDGNGKVENPGDDVGVLQYANGAIQRLQASKNTPPQTEAQSKLADKAVALLEGSQISIQDVIDLNVEALSTDTVEDMLPLIQEADQLFSQLMYGEDWIGGLWWANNLANRAIGMSLISQEKAGEDTIESVSDLGSGALKLDAKKGFSFQTHNLSVAPKDMAYILWASNPDEERYTSLGSIPAGELSLSGTAPNDLFEAYNQVALSLESESDAKVVSPSRILMEGDLSQQAYAFYTDLTSPPDSAPLAKAEEQAAIAAEHMQYLFEAFKTDNLPLAKRHAEHIINTLEGENGPNFGDVNGDGNVQNPGDKVGVLGYLEEIEATATSLQGQSLSPEQAQNLETFLQVQQAVADTIQAAFEAASKVIASDTIAEAQSNAENYRDLLQAVSDGRDLNGDGVIDPFSGEGGLVTLRQLAESIGWINLAVIE